MVCHKLTYNRLWEIVHHKYVNSICFGNHCRPPLYHHISDKLISVGLGISWVITNRFSPLPLGHQTSSTRKFYYILLYTEIFDMINLQTNFSINIFVWHIYRDNFIVNIDYNNSCSNITICITFSTKITFIKV